MSNKFEDVFAHVVVDTKQLPEFPIDVIAPGKEPIKVYYSKGITDVEWSEHNLPVDIYLDGDFILVPLNIDNKDRNDINYGQVLFYGAYDNNVVVYDSTCKDHIVSKKLIALMKTCIRRNGGGVEITITDARIHRGNVTDIFVEKGTKFEDGWNPVNKIVLHEIDSEIWNKAMNFGYSYVFPTGKNKYILAVDNYRNDSTISPEKDGMHGIAMLDNRVVLLGAY